MKKISKLAPVLAICFIFLLVSGCDQKPQKMGTANSGEVTYERVCVDGVEYLYKSMGHGKLFAPHFRPNGTLYTCGN